MSDEGKVARSDEEFDSEGEYEVEEYEEEEAEMDIEEEELAQAQAMLEILATMKQEGPIVECVMLRAETGKVEQITVDMSPKKNVPAELLGGAVTFAGQFEDIQVIVMAARDPLKRYKSDVKLPFPMHRDQVTTDLLLVRMDDASIPADFKLSEWNAYCSKDMADQERAWDARQEAQVSQ